MERDFGGNREKTSVKVKRRRFNRFLQSLVVEK